MYTARQDDIWIEEFSYCAMFSKAWGLLPLPLKLCTTMLVFEGQPECQIDHSSE